MKISEKTFNLFNKDIDGPWKEEPDFVVWTEPETGYLCYIKRHPRSLHLNGYVEAPKNNRIKELESLIYTLKSELDDLTYDLAYKGITYNDELEDKIVYGFDCAHCGDYNPRYPSSDASIEDYKNIEFVKNECNKLAKKLKVFEK